MDTTSKIFFFFIVTFSMFALVRVVSTLLYFLNHGQALIYSITLVVFIQSLAAAMVAYLVANLKFPRISPWLAFSVILFLGLLMTFFTADVPYQPSVEKAGAINWGFTSVGPSVIYLIIRLALLLFIFIPLIIILFKQFKTAADPIVKKRALGFIFVLLIAITIGLIDFILNNLLKLDAVYRDVVVSVLGVLLFVIVFTTQKPTSFPYVKKIEEY